MNAAAEVGSVGDRPAELAVLEDLAAHDKLLRHFADIHFDRVRHLRPLADEFTEDSLARARRRADELPSRSDLEAWYRILRTALTSPADEAATRLLVRVLMDTLRGKMESALVPEAFVIALKEERMSPQIIAGAVKRTWTQRSVKPTLQAFLRICAAHRKETQDALDQVVRTMGLRKDAEKVAGR